MLSAAPSSQQAGKRTAQQPRRRIEFSCKCPEPQTEPEPEPEPEPVFAAGYQLAESLGLPKPGMVLCATFTNEYVFVGAQGVELLAVNLQTSAQSQLDDFNADDFNADDFNADYFKSFKSVMCLAFNHSETRACAAYLDGREKPEGTHRMYSTTAIDAWELMWEFEDSHIEYTGGYTLEYVPGEPAPTPSTSKHCESAFGEAS